MQGFARGENFLAWYEKWVARGGVRVSIYSRSQGDDGAGQQ